MSCLIRRILQFQQAMKYCSIVVFDGENKDITLSCMYSWSVDGICWTNWTNYQTYQTLTKNIESDFYLRILLFGSLGSVAVNESITNCYNITLDTTNAFLVDFCGNQNLYNPYIGWDCALQLQNQTANTLVCMFGIPVYYFKVAPVKETADYTFKEYLLHNVESVKQIKLMIPNGTMPSSKPQFSDMDFDWEVDWEVELGKQQFATAFGDTAFPKQRDLVYIPMMKRMWEVNSAYDEKNEGFMWQAITWKLGLVKWNEKTNVTGMEDIINQFIVNKYEDVFGVLESTEQERESGISQVTSPTKVATNLDNIFIQDAIRKTYTKDKINISQLQLNQKSVVSSKNVYTFSLDGKITYQKGICGDSGCISFICQLPINNSDVYDIFKSGSHLIRLNGMKLCFGNMFAELEANNWYLINITWNRNTFTSEMSVYKHIKPVDIPEYRIRPEMKYFDFDNPVYSSVDAYNNDYIYEQPQEISLTGYPLNITNIKVFNRPLDHENLIKESLKYTTNNINCVINDVARPIDDGHGYAVR